MRAYEVFLNGKRLCVAGIGDDGYISACITHRTEPDATWIDVIGAKSRKKVYVRWTRKDLFNSDEVLVRIVDRKSANKYKRIRGMDKQPNMKALKDHTRKMAKEFGWEINERPKPKR